MLLSLTSNYQWHTEVRQSEWIFVSFLIVPYLCDKIIFIIVMKQKDNNREVKTIIIMARKEIADSDIFLSLNFIYKIIPEK